jgi:hypothetical protein
MSPSQAVAAGAVGGMLQTGSLIEHLSVREAVPVRGTACNYLSAAIAKAGARNGAEAVRTTGERSWL